MLNKVECDKLYELLETKKGRVHQLCVAIEEFSELTKELTKYMRDDSYTNSKKICEEIADSEIVLEQLKRFFDSNNELVPFMKEFKLKRLKIFYLNNEHK